MVSHCRVVDGYLKSSAIVLGVIMLLLINDASFCCVVVAGYCALMSSLSFPFIAVVVALV